MGDLKHAAMRIFRQTLESIDIPSVMRRKLNRTGPQISVSGAAIRLDAFERISVVAFGKASEAMACGLCETLSPDFRPSGIIVAPNPESRVPEGFRLIVAGHPIPNSKSFEAGRAILDLLATSTERTLLFFLLSGGGSALVELPLDPAVSLEDVQTLNRVLVTCGASIEEINAIRKHLSAVKGGRLAAAAAPAMKITLGVTDVPEGHESALASGPTLPDPSTVSDACAVIARYELLSQLPRSIRTQFEHPESIPETPKAGDAAFDTRRTAFQLLLGRYDLFHHTHRASEAEGFVTACDNTTDNWPLERAADYLLEQLRSLKQANPGRPVALIADGEVSSPVTGNGVGGRNSALVLNCVGKIAGEKIAVLSAGTDGIDGSSPAAGAVADGQSLARALSAGLDLWDFFRRSDSYTFFHALGDAIETGPTGNNLRDLRILLAD